MKRRGREYNIFSMAALDLFASALGAFILISVVLLPYFPNTRDWREVAELRGELDAASLQLDRCLAGEQQRARALQRSERDLAHCAAQLKRRFVLVLMSWGTFDDVDLHVVDPDQREFYFRAPRHAGSPAKLEEDNTRGPGNEIWLHPAATAGEYRVYYRYYTRRTRDVEVRGAVLTPAGRVPLQTRHLSVQGEKPLVAVISVDAQGTATVRAP